MLTSEPSAEWLEQQAHERMKTWMLDNGWSVTICASPEDILIAFEEANEDDAFDIFIND